MIQRIFVPDNPSTLEIITNYSDFQYFLAFGTDAKKFSKEKLTELCEKIAKTKPADNIAVIYKLLQEKKINSAEAILYLNDINLEPWDRKKGYAKNALEYLLDVVKRNAPRYEYLLCNAVTSDGVRFSERNKFENIIGNFWGKRIH